MKSLRQSVNDTGKANGATSSEVVAAAVEELKKSRMILEQDEKRLHQEEEERKVKEDLDRVEKQKKKAGAEDGTNDVALDMHVQGFKTHLDLFQTKKVVPVQKGSPQDPSPKAKAKAKAKPKGKAKGTPQGEKKATIKIKLKVVMRLKEDQYQ